MDQKIQAFKDYVAEISANPQFFHHLWFVDWHLKIVERIARELLRKHPEADRDLVEVMVWLHDYAKVIDCDNPHQRENIDVGRDKLIALGFDQAFADKAADYVEWSDRYKEVDLRRAPIEVQILSTSDGCSHLAGPFMMIFWNTETDPTFKGLTFQDLMEANKKKAHKDWDRKIVLPEARQAFEGRYHYLLEQSGDLPDKFL